MAKEAKLRYDKRKVLGYRQPPHTIEPETQKELQQKTLLSNHARSELKAVHSQETTELREIAIHGLEKWMNRGFHADSNLKWCTDVTELKYGNGRGKPIWSAIVDVYDTHRFMGVKPLQQQNSSWIR
ncbi:hypothetical protein P7H25_13775 [Paenibacillus larvae]|nr:hypothetical protein [Paenibacillus larvae]MDT2256479.1 hypothetical protein [Paenibacillus larvae]